MAQTSIHIQPVKGGSEEHNKREKQLDYVRHDLSHLNEYWEKDTQAHRLEDIKQKYKASTRQSLQKKATPIREAVVVIENGTTMYGLRELATRLNERFGIECFQIAIHKDEGYQGSGSWKPNLHAHEWRAAERPIQARKRILRRFKPVFQPKQEKVRSATQKALKSP